MTHEARARSLRSVTISDAVVGKRKDGTSLVTVVLNEGLDLRVTNSTLHGDLTLIYFPPERPPALTASVEINGSTIEGNVTVSGMILGRRFLINDSLIKGDVLFANVRFDQDLSFQGVIFEGIVDFLACTFRQTVSFVSGATYDFGGRTLIPGSWAIFKKDTKFRQCRFESDAHFVDAVFHGDLTFLFVDFAKQGLLGFQNAEFRGDLKFSQTNLGEIVFKDIVLHKRFTLSDSQFARLRLRWTDIKGKLSFDDQTFQRLIGNFIDAGQFDDADDALYAYKVMKREAERRWYEPRYWLEVVLDITTGYGLKPIRVISTGCVLILLFSALLTAGQRNRRFRDAFYLSAATFLRVPVRSDLQPGEEAFSVKVLSLQKRNIEGKTSIGLQWITIPITHRVALLFESVLGWFFFALFLASVTRTFLR